MGPSLLEYGSEKEDYLLVCARRFAKVDGETAHLVRQYCALLHEALLAA